jgi:hypothetical protein
VLRKLTELSNVHDIVLVLQNSSLVVIYVKVVGCTENGHDTRETGRPGLPVHAISGVLSFVSTNDGKEVVLLEESACRRVREEVRASTDVVVDEEIIGLLLTKLFQGIGPEDVAHEAVCGRLPETVNLVESAGS